MIGWLVVISGRERSVLAVRLPAGWTAMGSYGLELPPALSDTGYPPGFDPDRATRDLEAARLKLQELSHDLPGTMVEVKRWGLALHFRAVPELAADRETWRRFRGLALSSGLSAIEGRLVYEMKPRDAVDKGWAVGYLAERLQPSAAIFTGDDLGDVPAWDRLRQLSSPTLPTLGVGVGSAEAPALMPDVCDLVLPDRGAVRGFCKNLRELAAE
jgi:alpha,alpha-trehalase